VPRLFLSDAKIRNFVMNMPKQFVDSLTACIAVVKIVEELQDNIRSIETWATLPDQAKEATVAFVKQSRPELENPENFVSDSELAEKNKTWELVKLLDECCERAKPLVRAVQQDLRKPHPVTGVTYEGYRGESYGALTLKLGDRWIGWHSATSFFTQSRYSPPSPIDSEHWMMLVRNEHEKAAASVPKPKRGKRNAEPIGGKAKATKRGPKGPTKEQLETWQALKRDWLGYKAEMEENGNRALKDAAWRKWCLENGDSSDEFTPAEAKAELVRFTHHLRRHAEDDVSLGSSSDAG
jgi:hypothetical protein